MSSNIVPTAKLYAGVPLRISNQQEVFRNIAISDDVKERFRMKLQESRKLKSEEIQKNIKFMHRNVKIEPESFTNRAYFINKIYLSSQKELILSDPFMIEEAIFDSLVSMQKMKNLEILILHRIKIGSELFYEPFCLVLMSSLPKLKVLSLADCGLNDQSTLEELGKSISQLKDLETLNLSENELSNSKIQTLFQITIPFAENNTMSGKSNLSSAESKRVISLFDILRKVNYINLGKYRKDKTVDTLDMSFFVQRHNECLAQISRLKFLSELHLSGLNLSGSMRFLAVILDTGYLKILDISNNYLNPADMDQLFPRKSGSSSCLEFSSEAKKSERIASSNFPANSSNTSDYTISVKSSNSVDTRNPSKSNNSAENFKVRGNITSTNKIGLQELYLSENLLNNEGFRILISNLHRFQSLKILAVDDNQISMISTSNSPIPQSLKQLNLSSNPIRGTSDQLFVDNYKVLSKEWSMVDTLLLRDCSLNGAILRYILHKAEKHCKKDNSLMYDLRYNKFTNGDIEVLNNRNAISKFKSLLLQVRKPKTVKHISTDTAQVSGSFDKSLTRGSDSSKLNK